MLGIYTRRDLVRLLPSPRLFLSFFPVRRPTVYSHGTPLPSLEIMSIFRSVKLALAAAALFGQAVTAHSCLNPSVRREWRSLSTHERAEWISAVKVKHWLTEDTSRLTDTSMPSVLTNYLIALLWCRPSTHPTLRSHPSMPTAHILMVR